jgi:hypothetical protein
MSVQTDAAITMVHQSAFVVVKVVRSPRQSSSIVQTCISLWIVWLRSRADQRDMLLTRKRPGDTRSPGRFFISRKLSLCQLNILWLRLLLHLLLEVGDDLEESLERLRLNSGLQLDALRDGSC